eukprot:720114_1
MSTKFKIESSYNVYANSVGYAPYFVASTALMPKLEKDECIESPQSKRQIRKKKRNSLAYYDQNAKNNVKCNENNHATNEENKYIFRRKKSLFRQNDDEEDIQNNNNIDIDYSANRPLKRRKRFMTRTKVIKSTNINKIKENTNDIICDKINGIDIHEYETSTISHRTRKSKKIRKQYTEQIQKEYD